MKCLVLPKPEGLSLVSQQPHNTQHWAWPHASAMLGLGVGRDGDRRTPAAPWPASPIQTASPGLRETVEKLLTSKVETARR